MYIERAKTDEALDVVEKITQRSALARRRSLILLSGAPGTGKTLVGIRAAVSEKINELAFPRPEGNASGCDFPNRQRSISQRSQARI